MGLFLPKPNKIKHSDYQEFNDFKLAHTQIQGWRTKQDDVLLISPLFDQNHSLFGIFEAQGSHQYANYLKQHFIEYLTSNQNFKSQNYEKALFAAFETIEKYLMTDEAQTMLKELDPEEKIGVYGGSTALLVLITKDEIFVANAGISRCVAKCQGKHKNMTTDHYAFVDQEKQRIISAGGEVWDNRINAHLPISRSFGHIEYKQNTFLDSSKQLVISQPDIRWIDQDDCDFILIGSHGFWQNWTNGAITDIIMERIESGKSLKQILEDCAESCISANIDSIYGLDNISCILIQLSRNQRKNNFTQ